MTDAVVQADEQQSPQREKKTFGKEIQELITVLCLRDDSFLRQTDGLLKPEYFEDSAVGSVVDITLRYFKKYKKAFGNANALLVFVKSLCQQNLIKKDVAGDALRKASSLWNLAVSDRQLVVDEVARFARHAAVENAVYEIVEKHIDKGNFDTIRSLLNKALDVGAYSEKGGYDYGAEIETRTDERVARQNGEILPDTITSGYPELDAFLPNGGWGRRELAVLMGRAKVGKSTALMDFAIGACGSPMKYNVLYVTLEVSTKVISDRADAHISMTAMNNVSSNNQGVKLAVQDWRDKSGRFIIEDYPTGTLKVSDLRRIIEKWKTEGVVFDLVVVDYADLMIPERDTNNVQENSRRVWVDLRGLASAEGFAVLTATQTNREGAKKMTATMTDVAEDFNKIRTADIVISINKTEDEVMRGECRLGFVAVRNGQQDFSVRVKQDISCMRFVTEVMGAE